MPGRDYYWMAEALRFAARGQYSTHPNPAVGCLIVKDDRVISAGWHQQAGKPHAEINAIGAADIPAGCDFFITLEPCSHHGRTGPCADAVLSTRPARVVVAMQDPNPRVSGRGLSRLREAGVEVVTGVLQAEAEELNAGFIKRMRQQRPLLTLKLACSLDGKTALANGASQWITGEAARLDVQFQRARAAAILSSSATVMADAARLNVRLSRDDLGQSVPVRQPLRIIVDRPLLLNGTEPLFALDGDVLVYTRNLKSPKADDISAVGGQLVELPDTDNEQQLHWMMQDLARREINSIHCECGPTLGGALLEAGLVDRLLVYQAPCILGDGGQPLVCLTDIETMDSRLNLRLRDFRRFDQDSRMTYTLE